MSNNEWKRHWFIIDVGKWILLARFYSSSNKVSWVSSVFTDFVFAWQVCSTTATGTTPGHLSST